MTENNTGAITGAGNTFTLTSGLATLAGTNTYMGNTAISAGTLALNGSLNGTSITVNGGNLTENNTVPSQAPATPSL